MVLQLHLLYQRNYNKTKETQTSSYITLSQQNMYDEAKNPQQSQ